MTFVEVVKRANRPGPPEHSILLRASAAGSVAVGIVACSVEGELSPWFALVAIVLVVTGNVFSYRHRTKPLPHVKLLLAAAVLGAFAWFFVTASADASAGDLGSVVDPLAALFTAIQATHSFDVPSRRDLAFSLAGSATLIAAAAAQAVDVQFGVFVLVWAVFALTGLLATWQSMGGGPRLRPAGIVCTVLAVVAVGGFVLAAVPAPRASSGFVDTTTGPTSGSAFQPSHLVPAGSSGDNQPASGSGPTGVGGFLGFAGPLDTAVRGSLGNEVVLRIRADRPTFWIAETFDDWSGQSWTEVAPAGRKGEWQKLDNGPPFIVPPPKPLGQGGGSSAGSASAGQDGPSYDYQTFYLATSGSNLVLHASQATEVWFPSRRIYVSADGTIKGDTALGAGSIYTVLSTVDVPTAEQLSAVGGNAGLTSAVKATDLQLPHAYPRVAALARRITAGKASVYAKVTALEHWIGVHTRYTTDIPPLQPGQDTVTEFLFGSRRGYCEQISTSLAVMLRSLGIPAREATGYVPGPYDPFTDLYEVQASDAHAWVQVWFPGYGWESFDPTAYVPLANPSPAAALGHAIVAALGRVPLLPTVPLAAALLGFALVVRRRRLRPPSWRTAVTRHLERAARRAALPVEAGDTLGTLAERLDHALGDRLPAKAGDVADATEFAAWSGREPGRATSRALTSDARRIRRASGPAARRAARTRPRAGRRAIA